MDLLDEKAEKLRALNFKIGGRGTRPAAGTQGLYLPEISTDLFDEQFVDQLIAGTPTQTVLENREKPVTLSVKRDAGAYSGTALIRQTDFGIRPIAVAGGAIKVRNELDITFRIVSQ